MRACVAVVLLASCAGAPPPGTPGEDPREALGAFLHAVERDDMEAAYRLLSGRWRARLTPGRLARDLREGGAAARDRLERARLAAAAEPVIEGGVAAFVVGGGRSVRLHLEAGGWRVDALE